MDSVVDRLTKININYNHGLRAPHKPLLILMSLAKLRNVGSSAISWGEVEVELTALLNRYGNNTNPRPQYPFTKLPNDGFWQLDKEFHGESVIQLRQMNPVGSFCADIEEQLLHKPHELFSSAKTIIEKYFSYAYAADLLTDCGFDPDEVLSAHSYLQGRDRARRDPRWRSQILETWGYQCGFCGYDAKLGGKPVALEAAHIRWFSFDGPDEIDNGIALCSIHHNLFGRGAIGFCESGGLKISPRLTATNSSSRIVIEIESLDFQNLEPAKALSTHHINWHDENVFLR